MHEFDGLRLVTPPPLLAGISKDHGRAETRRPWKVGVRKGKSDAVLGPRIDRADDHTEVVICRMPTPVNNLHLCWPNELLAAVVDYCSHLTDGHDREVLTDFGWGLRGHYGGCSGSIANSGPIGQEIEENARGVVAVMCEFGVNQPRLRLATYPHAPSVGHGRDNEGERRESR